MLVNVFGAKSVGIDALKVTVEVDIRNGIGIHLVGLADTAVKESLLRTINALQALEYHIPGKKIVINLAPADLHKSGSGYDLPIALGVVAASGQKEMPDIGRFVIMGELGLDGSVRDIPGSLVYADMARKEGFDGCILPVRSALEAVEFTDTRIYGIRNFNDAIAILSGEIGKDRFLIWNTPEYACLMEERSSRPRSGEEMDFSEIIGQESAKRGAEIAASGNHNILLIGSPGSGKSSLAKAMAGILPPMSPEESLVTSKIYSVSGKGDLRYGLIRERPFRSPHYSASLPALIGGGGGDNLIPGEISLSHNGVLFLDEFTLMPKSAAEALRAPIEDRKITVSRLRSKVEYPASFMLVAASNPCPCGYWGEGDRCKCTPGQRNSHLARLSGPMMDRIDIQLHMRSLDASTVSSARKGENSASIAKRVLRAREVQRERFKNEEIFTNAEMNNRMMERYCPLSEDCREVMETMMERFGLSMRAYFRIIKVARTIADLAEKDSILPEHLLEAAGYRFLDRARQ